MTLHQLKCFTTLSQTLHYTEAANQLFLSQPSLSYAIHMLENELGVKLFEKHGRTISMTKFAKEFLPFALTAIKSFEAGKARLKEMQNPKNLRLGYIYSLSYDFLPNVLTLLLTIKLDEQFTYSFYQSQADDLIKKILDDELDFAFTPFSEEKGISSLPIFTQDIYLVVPNTHRLANQRETTLNEIRDEKFVMIKPETNLRYVIDTAFLGKSFKPNIVFEGDECNSIASYVASDYGIALIPKIPSLDGFRLSFLRISDLPLSRQVYLVWKTDSGIDPIVHKIQQAVVGQIGELTER